jgi:hypothetical protein
LAHRFISLGCGIWSLLGHIGLWQAARPADSCPCGLGSALNGEGANSPFSAALSRHIGTAGIEVPQI